ncbi:MAG TPA: hypothetical protein VLH08_01310 [Acidobacteriota bacterium]|nr:hypothetical protein [Acidobacteriota bacterium]
MKVRTISMIVLAVAISLVISTADWIYAADQENGCSKATLQGSFGFYQTGFTPDGALAGIGTVSYDGKGNSIVKQSKMINGVFEFEKLNNTYVVNPDCTGKAFSDGVEISRFTVVDRGNGVVAISRTSGNSVFVVAKKMHPSTDTTTAGSTAVCSKSTLQGSYGFYRTGLTADGPLAAIGIITYDGNGNNHGRQTISRNGVFEHLEFNGTYEVNPDCTTDSGAIVVDGGNELYNLSKTSGNAVYVVSRKIQ